GLVWYANNVQKDIDSVEEVPVVTDDSEDVEETTEVENGGETTNSISEDRRERQEIIAQLYTNVEEKLETGEMVWYEIPELGIRFPVEKSVKEELVYANIPITKKMKEGDSGKTSLTYFSTKKMENLSSYCSAENGPLGSLSRRAGEPTDPSRSCGGGLRVHDFDGGYFCFTTLQATCAPNAQEFTLYGGEIQSYWELFRSQDFWNTVIIDNK
ncbi:MAG: hypothetical protein KC736_04535, partial [Candidatus Moranbacteria bacterium]|nr:hypothetical protein [Candidatus Moranbacteria bacterium]